MGDSNLFSKTLFFLIIFSSITVFSSGTSFPKSQNSEDIVNMVFVGASNTEEGYRANVSYVSLLKTLGSPWDDANLINEGHAGWGMFSYFNKPNLITQNVIDHRPTFVFLDLGGNDYATGQGNKLNESYRYFLDTMYQLDVNNTIKDVFIINFRWGVWLKTASTSEIESFEESRLLLQDISEDYNHTLIDFHQEFINKTEYFIENDGHVNDLGHQVIAEQIHNAVADIIAPPVSSSQTTVSTNSTEESSIETNTNDTSYPSAINYFPVVLIVIKFRSRKFK